MFTNTRTQSRTQKSMGKDLTLIQASKQQLNKDPSIQFLLASYNQVPHQQPSTTAFIKTSFISDSLYNSTIYEWRKIQEAPIVNVLEIAKRPEVDIFSGQTCFRNYVKAEAAQYTLLKRKEYTKQQLLYILKNMLEGHEAIFKMMNATSVSLQKSIVNSNGKLKVWVNQQLEKNDISGEILSKQDKIVRKIFETIYYLANQNQQQMKDFIDYIQFSCRKTKKWSFFNLKVMLKSYCDCTRTKIPTNLLTKKHQNRKSVQTSLICRSTFLDQPKSDIPKQRSSIVLVLRQPDSVKSSRTPDDFCYKSNMSESVGVDQTYKSFAEDETNCSTTGKILSSKNNLGWSKIKRQGSRKSHNDASKSKPKNVIKRGREQNKIPRKRSSINEILISKIGFQSLPEVYGEEESIQSSARRPNVYTKNNKTTSLTIASQFSLAIDQDAEIKKNNLNQPPQFCFSRKGKDSHFLMNLQDNITNKENICTQNIHNGIQKYKIFPNNKEFTGLFNINKQINETNKFIQQSGLLISEQNIEISRNQPVRSAQVSIKQLNLDEPYSIITPQKSSKEILRLIMKHPLTLLNELRSMEELQSYENTQKDSKISSQNVSSGKRLKLPIEQKILSLLSMKRGLAVSTYMQTNSQKRLYEKNEGLNLQQREIRDIEETLAELIQANIKQNQVLAGNNWTKRLQNLLGMEEEMKQSMNFGAEEACALLRQIKLSRIGNFGRNIGQSLVQSQ